MQYLSELGGVEKKELIKVNLLKHTALANDMQSGSGIEEYQANTYSNYLVILDILPDYYCLNPDSQILQYFFSNLWSDLGMALETPSNTLAAMFICQNDAFIKGWELLSADIRKELIHMIEFGLTNQKENQDYLLTKLKLD